MGFMWGLVTGAILAFLFDLRDGNRRRAELRDRTAGIVRRDQRTGANWSRKVGSDAAGWRERMAHASAPAPDLNDATLAPKIHSEVFRDRRIDKGAISLKVEDGIVVLRRQLEHPEEIELVEERAVRVEGVVGVRNRLHLPGSPIPDR